jgi:hypothetical protein
MTSMLHYCKAYRLGELRRFAGWSARASGESAVLPDEQIVYLCADLSVVTDPITPGQPALWDAGGDPAAVDSWQDFCRLELSFDICGD